MGRLAHDYGWCDTFTSRITRMVQRDRNHASIIFWSMGNEAGRGRNLCKARDLVKQLDPSRPIQYESGGALAEGVGRTELTDVVCTMYPDVARTIQLATRSDEDRPVVLCEYSHAMGNSNGNLHLYWKAFWDKDIPRLQGGFIWDMIDQGLRKQTASGESYFAYGGDFGDTYNDLQFCINGMFSPDRDPHPAVSEIKFLMQPAVFHAPHRCDDMTLHINVPADTNAQLVFDVANRYTFLDLSHLTWSWIMTSDQSLKPVYVGHFDLVENGRAVLILDEAIARLNCMNDDSFVTAKFYLNLRGSLKSNTLWANAGHVLVTQQFPIEFNFTKSIERPKVNAEPQNAHLLTKEGEFGVGVTLVRGSANTPFISFEKQSGALALYTYGGKNCITKGISMNFTRASTDNDNGGLELALDFLFPGMNVQALHGLLNGHEDFSHASRWRNVGLSQRDPPETLCRSTDIIQSADRQRVTIVVISEVFNTYMPLFKVVQTYTAFADGKVCISCQVSPQPALQKIPSLPRVGLSLQLDPSLYNIQYFGRGPDENYPDRNSGSEMGRYQTTPSTMGYNYIVPVENGCRTDCEWIAFRNDDGTGLCIASGDEPFCCSALLHSASELDSAKHTYDLAARKDGQHPIHVNLDHKLMGLGGDTSWYPVVYPEYLVKPTCDYDFSFWLLPLQAKDDPATLVRSVVKHPDNAQT
jgi:beta-galactosidase